jgi:hypothetical protein
MPARRHGDPLRARGERGRPWGEIDHRPARRSSDGSNVDDDGAPADGSNVDDDGAPADGSNGTTTALQRTDRTSTATDGGGPPTFRGAGGETSRAHLG